MSLAPCGPAAPRRGPSGGSPSSPLRSQALAREGLPSGSHAAGNPRSEGAPAAWTAEHRSLVAALPHRTPPLPSRADLVQREGVEETRPGGKSHHHDLATGLTWQLGASGSGARVWSRLLSGWTLSFRDGEVHRLRAAGEVFCKAPGAGLDKSGLPASGAPADRPRVAAPRPALPPSLRSPMQVEPPPCRLVLCPRLTVAGLAPPPLQGPAPSLVLHARCGQGPHPVSVDLLSLRAALAPSTSFV